MEKGITIFELISNLVYKINIGKLKAQFVENDDQQFRKIMLKDLDIFIVLSHDYDIRSGDRFLLSFNSSKGSEEFVLKKEDQKAVTNMITDTIWHLKQKSYQEILEQINKE